MEADRWARRCAEGPLTPEEAKAFNAWIMTNPDNEQRFQAAKQFARELNHVSETPELDEWMRPSLYERIAGAANAALGAISAFKPIPRWTVVGGPVLAAAAIAVFLSIQPQTPELAPPVRTEIAEVREVDLPDGSRVTIGAASSVSIAFNERERRVILSAGEAYFDVEEDADRPFIVVADNTLVRVLGTKFDVSLGTDAIDVAVSEGRVEVIRPEESTGKISDRDIKHVLIAGQQVTAKKRGAVQPVKPIQVEDVAAWRRGDLQWADTPIRDIIADLNRYSEEKVILEARDVASLEYTLAVQADEIDEAVSLIAASLQLDVIERSNGDRVLR